MDQDFCHNCFIAGPVENCPHCGYSILSQANGNQLLIPGTMLKDKYRIGRTLGAGGFGITYLAKDISTSELCAIKEYFPSALSVRDDYTRQVYPSSSDNAGLFEQGRKEFKSEAEALCLFLGNPFILQVTDMFELNGTSYYVMEYLDGVNLKALAYSMGGKLPAALALEVLQSVCSILSVMHERGLLHRNICPENIFITKKGIVKLIDFCAARFFIGERFFAGERSQSFSVILKPGFSSPEMYSAKGKQGPWTDVYSAGASFLCAAAGASLPDVPARLAGAMLDSVFSLAGIKPGLKQAIEKSLEIDCRDRYQSAAEFLAHISRTESAKKQAKMNKVQISLPSNIEAKGVPFIRISQGDKWMLPSNIDMKIGRAPDSCNIILEDKDISRIHCIIRYENNRGEFTLTDLSSNGTYIQGGRMQYNVPQNILPGSRFAMPAGKYEMEVGVE